jgi:hypothetical protein
MSYPHFRPISFAGALLLVTIASAGDAQRPGKKTGERPKRPADRLHVGDEAPDFTLKTLDGTSEVTLSDFRGKRPVALVFGSYT